MQFSNEITIGTFKITLKKLEFNAQALIALNNNMITTDLSSVSTTRRYISDNNIYVEVVSKQYRYIAEDKILTIKKNIQQIIKYEICNFVFIPKSYSEHIDIIRKKESERINVIQAIYRYFFN